VINVPNSVNNWIKTHRNILFPLIAFALPLLVRVIPEILMMPYVTGFDTMGHYVPTTLLWLKGGVTFWGFLATAPLFYLIIVFFISSGGTLITVLKVVPPLLLGFLGLSIYGYAKRGLGWSPSKSTITALLATLYFVSLRISWDMLRNELGLALFFVVLMLINFEGSALHSWKRYLTLSLAMCLVVLAHQLVSVIMFGVVALTIIYYIFKKNGLNIKRLVGVSLPAILVFLGIFYFSSEVPEYRIIFGFSQSDGWLSLFGFPSYQAMLTSIAGFFLFCFLPILPFVIIGFKRLKNFQLYAWVLLGVIGALIPMVSPSNLRWVMMLTYPFAFYVIDALSRIKRVSLKRFKNTLYKFSSVYLVLVLTVLSLGLIFFTPETPMPYFNAKLYNGYVYQMPTSMLQNTVSIADCKDTANALQWLSNNMEKNATLLSHRAFYGWALSTFNRDKVFLYEYGNPEDAAKNVTKAGHTQIYLIWWVSGQGWYGQPTVPTSFKEIYYSGRIAIYSYYQNFT
jgi:hypothetical protein